MLGRAGGLAHRPRGKRGERRRGQSGCLCFIWNCPPLATRGRPRLEAVWPVDARTQPHTHTHTDTLHPSHIRSLSSLHNGTEPHFYTRDLTSCLSPPSLWWCGGGQGLQRTTISCVLEPARCLSYAQSRAAAFAGLSLLTRCSLSTVYKHSDTGSSVY